MELGDKPELRPHSAVLVVGGNEAKNVVVAEHHRLSKNPSDIIINKVELSDPTRVLTW